MSYICNMIENKIIKTELVKWKDINDLQPNKFKNILNREDVKDGIKLGDVNNEYEMVIKQKD